MNKKLIEQYEDFESNNYNGGDFKPYISWLDTELDMARDDNDASRCDEIIAELTTVGGDRQ